MSSSATSGGRWRQVLAPGLPAGPLRVAIIVVAMLTLLTLVTAGAYGLAWYRAAHDRAYTVGMMRDEVRQDAQQAALTLNTLDYRRVQDALTLWQQVAAGPMLTDLQAKRATYARAITEAETSTTARVLDAAVVALDERAGTAQALIALDVTAESSRGEPTCTHRRVRLDMVRAGDTWKVTNLTPVGEIYPQPGACPPPSSPK